MLSMTAEELKVLVKSHDKKRDEIVISGGDPSHVGVIEPWVIKLHSGKYGVVFCTPMGDITMKSSRQDTRLFASIDSAMSVINYCGKKQAKVMSGSGEFKGSKTLEEMIYPMV